MEKVVQRGTPGVEGTLPARLAKAGASHTVMIMTVCNEDHREYAGTIATFTKIDPDDADMTFQVTTWDGKTFWVHAVEPASEVAVLQVELQKAREAVSAANDLLCRYQGQVRDKAIEVANEQGWCDAGLNEVLDDLGLQRKEPKKFRFEVTATFEVEATVEAGNESEVSNDWIQASLSTGSSVTISLDGDWEEGVVVGSPEWMVNDWSEVEES